MRITRSLARLVAFATAVAWLAGAPARAALLQISVTNDQPVNAGFGISPVWVGLHDGTFATFTPGGASSSALQAIAELADTSKMTAAFAGHGSQTTVGSAPIIPGASATTTLDVANPAADPYLSFASMVVPSNDFFFGNPNPKGFQLFGPSGQFIGPTTIQIFGTNVWDAGTEVNNINFGAAFIAADDIADHVAEDGTIQLVFGGANDLTSYLNSISGKATPAGYDISHLISPADLIATIQITAVPEPSTFVLGSIGIVAGLGWGRVRSIRRGRAAAG